MFLEETNSIINHVVGWITLSSMAFFSFNTIKLHKIFGLSLVVFFLMAFQYNFTLLHHQRNDTSRIINYCINKWRKENKIEVNLTIYGLIQNDTIMNIFGIALYNYSFVFESIKKLNQSTNRYNFKWYMIQPYFHHDKLNEKPLFLNVSSSCKT